MPPRKTQRMDIIDRSIEAREIVSAAGYANDPVLGGLLPDMITTPLEDGAISEAAFAMTHNIAGPKAMANQIASTMPQPWPNNSAKDPFTNGTDIQTREPITIPGCHFTRHFLMAGPSGAGKSTFIRRIINWFTQRLIPILYVDHKDDGRKLLNIFKSVLVISVTQIYENLIKPIGDASSYYSMFCAELSKRYPLHPGTEGKLVEILCDMHEGLSKEQPHFSLKDVEDTVSKLAGIRSDPTLKTAARSVAAFNRSLGRAAYVREGPGVECGKWLIVVLECMGVNYDFLGVYCSIRLNRFMLRSRERGHSDKIQSGYISDEGQFEFGKQFQSRSGSNSVDSSERRITQVRSLGNPLVVGVQHVSKVMSVLPANVGSFLSFGVQSEDDARLSANLLGMKSREERDSLWNPPEYCAWFKCALSRQYRLIRLEDMPAGDVPSSAEVAQRMAPDISWLEAQCEFSPIRNDIRTPINYKVILGDEDPHVGDSDPGKAPALLQEQVDFLNDVVAHPDLSIRARYAGLNLSGGRGHRIKESLLSQNLIESVSMPSDGGRPIKHLTITAKGQEYLDGLS